MRYLLLLLLVLPATAQNEQPGIQYSSYTLLLVPQQGEGFLIAVDKQQKIVFVPISSVSKAVKEEGVSPVRYGELLQLLRQLGEENQRLKTENDHLWKIAEKPGSTTSVTVQQSAPPPPDPDAERRQMRTVLLRSLLAPRFSTVNVNVTDCSRFPALCVNH